MSRLTGPMFAAEWRQTFRRYKFLVWTIVALDALALLAVAWFAFGGGGRATFAPVLFGTLAGAHFCFIAMIGPAMGSAAVAEERRNCSAGLLLLTDLSRWDIVLGKFASRAAMTLLVLALSVPLLALAAMATAVPWAMVARLLTVTAVAAVSGVAVGVWVAMVVPRTAQAGILTYFALLLLFVILPSTAQLVWLEYAGAKGSMLWLDAWSPLFAFHHELAGLWPGAAWARCAWSAGVGLALTGALVAASGATWSPARVRRWEAAETGVEVEETRNPKSEIRNSRLTIPRGTARFTPAVACAFFLVMFLGIIVMQWPHMTWPELARGISAVYFPVSWFLVNVALVLYGARAFAEEKESGTLELLATTPLSNATLVWNKMAALLRSVGSVPATLAGCQLALWMAGGEPKGVEAPSVMMLAGTPIAVATRLVHFYLVMIGALWLSAWCRNSTRASLGALVAFLAVTWICVAASEWLLGYVGVRAALTGPSSLLTAALLAMMSLLWRVAAAAVLHLTLNQRLRVFAAQR